MGSFFFEELAPKNELMEVCLLPSSFDGFDNFRFFDLPTDGFVMDIVLTLSENRSSLLLLLLSTITYLAIKYLLSSVKI